MTPSSIELSKINLFDCSIDKVKIYTVVTTRPELNIKNRTIVEYFGGNEKQESSSWTHGDFAYNISELGFRDSDFPESVDIAAFGCSYTFGLGLPENMIWHRKLSDKINKSIYNFGQPGMGVSAIIDLFLMLDNNLNFKKGIFLLPPYFRKSVACSFDERSPQIVPLMPNYKSFLEILYDTNYSEIYKHLPDEELVREFKDKIYMLDFYAGVKNIKLYLSSWDHETYNLLTGMNLKNIILLPEWTSANIDASDLARDNLHPGPIHHSSFAEIIKDLI